MRILAQLQTLDDALYSWHRYQQIPVESFALKRSVYAGTEWISPVRWNGLMHPAPAVVNGLLPGSGDW